MEVKDWLTLLIPSILSIAVLILQIITNQKVKKFEQTQTRKSLIIDEYILLLREYRNVLFLVNAHFQTRVDTQGDIQKLKESANSLLQFIYVHQFMLKKHEDKLKQVYEKIVRITARLQKYKGLEGTKTNDYSQKEREELMQDIDNTLSELKDVEKLTGVLYKEALKF
jgi:hypothetical protein